MKLWIGLILLTLCQPLQAQQGSLTISIEGIRNAKGKIQLYVYNQKEDHLITEQAFKAFRIAAQTPEVSISLERLPPGEYSVAFYHDENEDSVCNLSFWGIPKEGYGFSRNYVPVWRAPHFEEVSFRVEKGSLIRLKVIY